MEKPEKNNNPPEVALATNKRKTRRPLITGYPAVLDACVLANVTVRDFLLYSAWLALYRPMWSTKIIDEMSGAIVKMGVSSERVTYLSERLQDAYPEAAVQGYDTLISVMTNDPKDRHVLAAAVAGRAQMIVTFNVKDFPQESLTPYSIQVKHPDDFLRDLLDLDEERMVEVLETISQAREMPPQTPDELLAALENAGCAGFAGDFREVINRRYKDR